MFHCLRPNHGEVEYGDKSRFLYPLVFEYEGKNIEKMNDDFYIEMISMAKKLKSVTKIVERKKKVVRFRKLISKMKNLEQIDVSNNLISQIPNEIEDLKRLKNLCLDSNEISSVNQSLSKLTMLEHLSVSNNYIYTLPNIFSNLRSMISADFSSNYISEFPESLLKMNKLSELSLSDNLLYQFISSEFAIDNNVIERIDLSNNGISEVPMWIKGMSNLTHIDLSNNNIKSIPSFIKDLPNLVFVDLRHNNIVYQGSDGMFGRNEITGELDDKVLMDNRILWMVKPLKIEDVLQEAMKNDLYWNMEEISKLNRLIPNPKTNSHEKIYDILNEFNQQYGHLLNSQISSIMTFVSQSLEAPVNILTPEIFDLMRAILVLSKKNQLIEETLFYISSKIGRNKKQLLVDLRVLYTMYKFDAIESDKVKSNIELRKDDGLKNDALIRGIFQENNVLDFIKSLIALEKDNVFDFNTILGRLDSNPTLVRYWKNELNEVLGFDREDEVHLEENNPIGSAGYVVESFLKKFRPRFVISKLCEYLNKNEVAKKIISQTKHDFKDQFGVTEKMVERYLVENRLLISNNN